MKRLIQIIVCCMFFISGNCMNLTVHVESAGNLINQIDLSKVEELTSLTISGDLNGTDILVINKMKNLCSLDMRQANIKAGGMPYYQNDNDAWECEDNTISPYFTYGLTSLTNMHLPNTVTTIDELAFNDCSKLKTLTINDQLQQIKEKAFQGCESLLSLSFPGSVLNIGDDVFNGCNNLSELEFKDSSAPLKIGNNTLDSYYWYSQGIFKYCNLKRLYIGRNIEGTNVFSYNPIKDVTISSNVTTLGDGAFLGCDSLKNIYLPNSVTRIGQNCFRNSGIEHLLGGSELRNIESDAFDGSNLQEFIAPHTLEYLDSSFDGCSNLTTIDISQTSLKVFGGCSNCHNLSIVLLPNTVEKIYGEAFRYCTNLKNIEFPNSLKVIYSDAFNGCENLKDIVFPPSIETIDKAAFKKCSSLEHITIPSSVKTLGYESFAECVNLKKLEIADSDECLSFDYKWDDRGGYTTGYGMNIQHHYLRYALLDVFKNNSSLSEIYIGRNIENPRTGKELSSHRDNCFYYHVYGENSLFDGLEALTTVELNKDVTYVGENLFVGCRNLKNIEFNEAPIDSIGTSSFSCTGITDLSLPYQTKKIGRQAFLGSEIEKITFGAFTEQIEDNVLDGCPVKELLCENPTPPAIKEATFEEELYTNGTLYVPIGSKNYYWIHPYWGKFSNIEEQEFSIKDIVIENVVQNIPLNEDIQFHATISPAYPNKKIAWKSDDPNIATVSEDGVVHGVSEGITKITASCDNCTYSCKINVVNTSSISEVQSDKPYERVESIYSLDGRKLHLNSLEGLTPGVYIINGRKILIK